MLMVCAAMSALGRELPVALDAGMVVNEAAWGDPQAMVDEQDLVGDPPGGQVSKAWRTSWQPEHAFPVSAYIDLGQVKPLSTLWVYDTFSDGDLVISTGSPGQWTTLTTYRTKAFNQWVAVKLDVATRYLRLTRMTQGCQFAEIALYAHTAERWQAMQDRKAAIERSKAEAANRPLVDTGPLFGKLPLVDEVDCASDKPGPEFAQFPEGASRTQLLLGQPSRTVLPRPGEASYVSWRVGQYKGLKAGVAYLLVIDYPEDEPRSMVVMNGGCETARGFHTGTTTGDALRARYVWSNPESLKVPLSGRYESWTQLFYLHDRFPERAYIRGAGPRTLTPDDGFPVTIAQFSAENDPPSRGIAVRRIRLFEVPDPRKLDLPLPALPEGLPRRHIFFREEMADGVIEAEKPEERGLVEPLDWYRFKAAQMRFLGINTYTKDLLEFGACQHWDSSPGGGNDWVFHSSRHKDLWGRIVKLMGSEGFHVLPYYEYAGSRGYKGIGHQRRARPLARDDAYTHIEWIEQANADITDPETLADFRKMLDLTVIRFKGDAHFIGAWLRPRMQMPVGFGDATRERFAREANGGIPVTRRQLIEDRALRQRYLEWWQMKRRDFLAAVRDHLRAGGLDREAVVLFTADASEPGVSFATWDRLLVTDDPAAAAAWLTPVDARERPIRPISLAEVAARGLWREALLTPPLDWGGWEVSHASPAADPGHYRQTPGVLMTHGFNRAYTVAEPATMELFRNQSGLAMIRHYSLNENMLTDSSGKDLLGYFVADVERSGPHCMLAEARAVAGGDPRFLGYLAGSAHARGFPRYVRRFNAAFLSLPALPSRVLAGACEDAEVVVREIDAGDQGVWLAIVNTGLESKPSVTIRLPRAGGVSDAVSGAAVAVDAGRVSLPLDACELRTLRIR